MILNTLLQEKQTFQCLQAVKCLFTVQHNKISILVKITRETSLFLFFSYKNKNKFHYACLNIEKQIEVDLSLATGNVWICGHCIFEE